jgi:hypothetical protein
MQVTAMGVMGTKVAMGTATATYSATGTATSGSGTEISPEMVTGTCAKSSR